jgi:ABC-type Fe3+ transport system substrate-binding protein
MMLMGSPAPNGAKIFLNWFLSREGQLVQYATDGSIPAHKDMEKDPRFLPYPEQIVGKTIAVRDEGKIKTDFPKLMAVYRPLWTSAGGPASSGAKDGE